MKKYLRSHRIRHSKGSCFVSFDPKKKEWTLENDLVVRTHGFTLTVPGESTSDLASSPRLCWWIISPFDCSIQAPIVHDWLYRHDGVILTEGTHGPLVIERQPVQFSKRWADKFFFDIALQEGVPRWRAKAAYLAVKYFGKSSWQGDHAE